MDDWDTAKWVEGRTRARGTRAPEQGVTREIQTERERDMEWMPRGKGVCGKSDERRLHFTHQPLPVQISTQAHGTKRVGWKARGPVAEILVVLASSTDICWLRRSPTMTEDNSQPDGHDKTPAPSQLSIAPVASVSGRVSLFLLVRYVSLKPPLNSLLLRPHVHVP